MPNIWQMIASFTFLAPLLAFRANRMYRSLPSLPPTYVTQPLPPLSIIIPARNEAHNLTRLLPSLTAVHYPGPLEIIVVDDQSEDETAVIAAQYGTRIIRTSPTNGWLGKTNACHQGAAIANGEWLLFTDADTVHLSHGPSSAVIYACTHGLDGLSLFLRQETNNKLDTLTLAAGFAGLFAGWNEHHSLLNGQFILLKRDVYSSSEGFDAVKTKAVEDVALGTHLRELGFNVPMMRGEHAASVNMYDHARQMWQGFMRLGGGALQWRDGSGVRTVLLITAVMTPFITILLAASDKLSKKWIPITWGTAVVSFYSWGKRFRSGWHIIFIPFGAFFVQLAATAGLIYRLFGQEIIWKGRRVKP
jgi:hypothetical protein